MCAGLGIILRQTKNLLSYNTKSLILRYVQTSENVNAKKYTASILLPQTKFPNRLNGRKRVEMDNYLLEVSALFYINLKQQLLTIYNLSST